MHIYADLLKMSNLTHANFILLREKLYQVRENFVKDYANSTK